MRLLSLIFLCLLSPSASKLSISEELQQRFEKGTSLFESEKFMRAKDARVWLLVIIQGHKWHWMPSSY